MLVLTRKKNERIKLGGGIEIVVVEIRHDKVRIGVEAPVDVPVHRGEVWDAIERKHPGEPVPSHKDQPDSAKAVGDA